MSCFCPSCREELGEHNRYGVKCGSKRKAPAQSPCDNIERIKTFNDFIQEKGKERHGFFKQKKIRNSSVSLPLLVSGHLKSKHPQTYVRRF